MAAVSLNPQSRTYGLALHFALGGAAFILLSVVADVLTGSSSLRALDATGFGAGDAADGGLSSHASACASRRGAPGGHWEQDLDSAPLQQYAPGVENRLGKANKYFPDPDDPINTKYRPPTTYVWKDSPETEAECGPVTPLNEERFCEVVKQLDLDRIMFVGDSITYYMSYALRAQIGSTYDLPNKKFVDDVKIIQDMHWELTHRCPNGRKVKIEEQRNDHLVDEYTGEKAIPVLPHWTETYLNYPGKTLLVVNTGAHFPRVPQLSFREVMDWFFTDLLGQKFKKPDDIIVMRTTPTGHPDCTTAVRPHATQQDYEASFRPENIPAKFREKVKSYQWLSFNDMNAYMKEKIAQYNSQTEPGQGPAVHLLDVAPMTNLRPDGHMSGPDNHDPEQQGFDCLHYSLPGPIDWFNNLLFANLADLPPARWRGRSITKRLKG